MFSFLYIIFRRINNNNNNNNVCMQIYFLHICCIPNIPLLITNY